MAVLFLSKAETILNSLGIVRDGGTVTFYASGTSTKLDTYSDDDLTTPNANPITLAAGRPSVNVYLLPAEYKVVFANSAGTDSITVDPVHGSGDQSTVSVRAFGAVGGATSTGLPDEHVAIQAAIDTGKTVSFEGGKYYNIGTVGVTFGNNNQVVYGNCATLVYSGTGKGVDAKLVGGIQPQNFNLYDLDVLCTAAGASPSNPVVGVNWRFTRSSHTNCTAACMLSNAIGWKLPCNISEAPGPYYNNWRNYGFIGKVGITGGVANQCPVYFEQDVGNGNGPNANALQGGRWANYDLPATVQGAGNSVVDFTTEGVASGAYHIKVDNTGTGTPGVGCSNNYIRPLYSEGASGSNIVLIGPGSSEAQVDLGGFVTSIGGGVVVTDNGSLTRFVGGRIGAYTPTLSDGTHEPTYNATSTKATYSLNGDMVTVALAIVTTAKGSLSGALRVSLPFTSASLANNWGGYTTYMSGIDLAGSRGAVTAQVTPGVAYALLYQTGGSAGDASIALADAEIANATDLEMVITYRRQ